MIHVSSVLLFTLVELLVTLGIIAVLAALLIAAIMKARAKADEAAKCPRLAAEINDALEDCKSYTRKRITGVAGTDDATLMQKLRDLKDKVNRFMNECIGNNNALATIAVEKINAAIRELNSLLPRAGEEQQQDMRAVIQDLNGLKRKIPQD